jgi:hypothetical protein
LVGNAFKALLVETDKREEYYSDFYFISIKSFLATSIVPAPTISITNTLIDNLISLSLIYQIIGENYTLEPIKQIKDTQIFIVNSILRYNIYYFYRIVINTGAFRFSTTSSN